MNLRYLVLETRRVLRSPRPLIFTVALPVVFFFIFRGLYGGGETGGIGPTAYLMSSMAAYGALMGTLFTGARTAAERQTGWQRQLRLTPLSPANYLLGKGIVGMAVALVSVLLVSVVGALTGVHMAALAWVQAVGGVWIAALPFAALGLLIGQFATTESLQIYTMSVMLLCGFLGGLFIPPMVFPGWLANVSKVLPSYWMADVGHGAVLGNTSMGYDVLALAGWTIVLSAAVMLRYRRDSARA
jgi:ABC-2 type transport system permease protein